MKFAFIIMSQLDSSKDRAVIGGGNAQIIGVSTIDEACRVAQQLHEDGVDCIELCGAFKEEGARKVIEATGNKLPVGYVVHLPEQDPLYELMRSKR